MAENGRCRYRSRVTTTRRCSRTACPEGAVATLTYDYGNQQAIVGLLSREAEPHGYDLCAEHASRLTAPRGWEVIRPIGEPVRHLPTNDDLEALADAVREAARGKGESTEFRRGHLRMLKTPDSQAQ